MSVWPPCNISLANARSCTLVFATGVDQITQPVTRRLIRVGTVPYSSVGLYSYHYTLNWLEKYKNDYSSVFIVICYKCFWSENKKNGDLQKS